MRGERQSPRRVALAVALGLFIGCLPVYGLHFVLCALVCLPLGLDLVLTYLVANISNPLVAPFLVTLEVEIGSLVSTGEHAAFSVERARQTGILGFAFQAGLGSIFVGAGLGALGAAVAYAIARKRRPSTTAPHDSEAGSDEDCDGALQRTIQRYRGAPIGDRIYVAIKLNTDPLTRLLSELPFDFGSVLDAAAGRGQFGLFLWELGRASALFGFDSDARKVDIAERAAASVASFETLDLLEFRERRVDTLLLIDVLHYLPLPEQDELLARAARCVPEGRIVIRELDAGNAARSAVTRGFEWLAKASGYNRGRAGRHYRPARELVAQLTRAGFSCQVSGASEGTPFANVLIVAARNSGVS